jgi:hypothetical protein
MISNQIQMKNITNQRNDQNTCPVPNSASNNDMHILLESFRGHILPAFATLLHHPLGMMPRAGRFRGHLNGQK